MTAPAGPRPDRARVQSMFARLAPRYDLANTLMTLGMSRRWRREILRRAAPRPGDAVLDLATGTGQIARDLRRAEPRSRVAGADLTLPMLRLARHREPAMPWLCLDATRLPFADATYDVVTHAYLLRYLSDLPADLHEQYRVLRPGGRLVALDTSPGGRSPIGRAAALVTRVWPRLVGRLVGNDAGDYGFLQDSSLAFQRPAAITAALNAAGFTGAGSRSYLGGMLVLYWAAKPRTPGRHGNPA